MDDNDPAELLETSKRRKPRCKKCGLYMEGHGRACGETTKSKGTKSKVAFDLQSISYAGMAPDFDDDAMVQPSQLAPVTVAAAAAVRYLTPSQNRDILIIR